MEKVGQNVIAIITVQTHKKFLKNPKHVFRDQDWQMLGISLRVTMMAIRTLHFAMGILKNL